MRAVAALALGDLRLTLKERTALFWMFLMPVAFIGVFGSFMGSGGEVRAVALAVIDEDQSFLSGQLLANLEGEGFAIEAVDSAGPASPRTLRIPRGFADSLAAGDRVALRFEAGSASAADRDLAAEVHVQKAVARLLAVLIELHPGSEGSEGSGSSEASEGMDAVLDTGLVLPVSGPAFEERFRSLRERPDPVQTVVTTAGKGRAVPQGFAASAPAMLVLFMLINTVIYGAVLLTEEKQSGCLRRLEAQPISRMGLLLGKLAGRLLLAMLQAGVLLAAGALLFRVYWGPSPLALAALLLCLALACASLGLLLGAVLRSPEQASAVGWVIPLFLGAIGGTWWPLEIVPHWMRVAAHVSPAAWAMDGLHGLISFGQGGEVVLVPCLVLLGYAGLFLGIGASAFRTGQE